MRALCQSLETLRGHVRVLVAFLRATERGDIPFQHALVRDAVAVCSQIPPLHPDSLAAELAEVTGRARPPAPLPRAHAPPQDFNSSLLASHLATTTRNLALAAELASKAKVAYHALGRGAPAVDAFM